MGRHEMRFPGESQAYRKARDELLEAEIELRARLQSVAELRRSLPPGGEVREDYVFEEATPGTGPVRLSELFTGDRESLILYSYMFAADAEAPCPMCTSFLDGLDRYVPHITQRADLAIVARAPAERLRKWASERGWTHLRLLSSQSNDYNRDYFGEAPDGSQLPACNVFTRRAAGSKPRHFYNTEVLYTPLDGHPRHVDLLWPIWSFFDLTPEGRGDWYPALDYR